MNVNQEEFENTSKIKIDGTIVARKMRQYRLKLLFIVLAAFILLSVIIAYSSGMFVQSSAPKALIARTAPDQNEEEYALMSIDISESIDLEASVYFALPDYTGGINEEEDAEIIEQEQDEAPEDEKFIQKKDEQEEKYPIIAVDGKVIVALKNSNDVEWVRSALLDRYTKPIAGGKLKKRGFVNSVEVLYQEEPEGIVSKEEGYEALKDIISVRLREHVIVSEKLPFDTVTVDDSQLEKGKTIVSRKGEVGKVVTTYEVVSINGEEAEKSVVGVPKISKQPVEQIVKIGTKKASAPKATKKPSSGNSSSAASIRDEDIIPFESLPAYSGSKSSYGSQKPGNYYSKPLASSKDAFPGSNVGMGEYYPNINTAQKRPDKNCGIAGPNPGSLDFIYPLASSKHISSYFGWRFSRMHYGIDFPEDFEVAVRASEGGKVTSYTGNHSGYGLTIEIDHGNGFTTRYAHCQSISVSSGQRVSKGDIIGTVGATGTSDQIPHLHFEIRNDGVPYNPLFYM